MKIDIGHNHQIEFVPYRDDPKAALNDYHLKADGTECKGFVAIEGGTWAAVFAKGQIATWKIEQLEPLTLSPSLLCRVCGDHGFIREGKWVPS